MPLTDLLMEGVELMLLGMGSVFLFLTTLVLTLKGMSRLAVRLQPEISPNESVSGTHVSDDAELIAVISAAVTRYRSGR